MLLFALLGLQFQFSQQHERSWQAELSPPPLPSSRMLTLAALGESQAMASLLTLQLQTFDAQAGQTLVMRNLDADAIGSWLDRISDLSPAFGYPSFLASRIYASTMPHDTAIRLLDRVEARFRKAPEQHWPWLAYAVHLAKHRLDDKPLARRYANTLRLSAEGRTSPQWARDLEVFLLQDLNELQAARTLLGGLIDSGRIADDKALAVMIKDLEAIERRLGADRWPSTIGRKDLDFQPSK
ncbi:MAG: hypothetical protein R3E68_03045 [Burkholderiaceae bacterium]